MASTIPWICVGRGVGCSCGPAHGSGAGVPDQRGAGHHQGEAADGAHRATRRPNSAASKLWCGQADTLREPEVRVIRGLTDQQSEALVRVLSKAAHVVKGTYEVRLVSRDVDGNRLLPVRWKAERASS